MVHKENKRPALNYDSSSAMWLVYRYQLNLQYKYLYQPKNFILMHPYK